MNVITILDQLKVNVASYNFFKNVQFVVHYHFFPHAYLITNYESLNQWFNFFLIKSIFSKHWIDSFGQGMVEVMYVSYFSDTFTTILKQLPHAIIMQFLKNSNMVDYICMYDVYELPYKRHIFDSLVITIKLTYFLMWQFIY